VGVPSAQADAWPSPADGDGPRLREQLISEHTGQSLEKVAKDTDRDYILTADEAKDYGVIDEIITNRGITPELAAAAAAGA